MPAVILKPARCHISLEDKRRFWGAKDPPCGFLGSAPMFDCYNLTRNSRRILFIEPIKEGSGTRDVAFDYLNLQDSQAGTIM